jgi:ribonuclease P protein component
MDEAHVSAERAQAGQDSWFPQAHVKQSRAGDHTIAAGQGSPSPVGVRAGRSGPGPSGHGVGPVRHRRTFERLRHSSNRGWSGPVSVGFVGEKTWSRAEVAYVIGRRVGTAVVRNRLRRRLRAILADRASSLPVGAYVVRAAPGAPQLEFEDLRVAVGRALEQAVTGRRGGRAPAWSGGVMRGAP